MNYRRLSNEELQKCPYPNLIAEWRESGYSFCTLGKHMGLGCYREENDSQIWRKLRGEDKITAGEAIGLSELFGVKMSYLFDDKLAISREKPVAYWRWYESNRKLEEDLRQIEERECIMREMRQKTYLFKAFKTVAGMNKEELEKIIAIWTHNGNASSYLPEGGDVA